MNEYIMDGRVAREKIVSDICKGVIGRKEIKNMSSNAAINKAFFGDCYKKKSEKKIWDYTYLEKLKNVAIAEAFNEDYLLYLVDVYEYVKKDSESKRKRRNRVIIVFIIIVVFTLICVGYSVK